MHINNCLDYQPDKEQCVRNLPSGRHNAMATKTQQQPSIKKRQLHIAQQCPVSGCRYGCLSEEDICVGLHYSEVNAKYTPTLTAQLDRSHNSKREATNHCINQPVSQSPNQSLNRVKRNFRTERRSRHFPVIE